MSLHPSRVFYAASAVFAAVALVFFADALGLPVYRRLAAAWAAACFATFTFFAVLSLFFGHFSEQLWRLEQRLDRLDRRLGARPPPEKKADAK